MGEKRPCAKGLGAKGPAAECLGAKPQSAKRPVAKYSMINGQLQNTGSVMSIAKYSEAKRPSTEHPSAKQSGR